MAQPKVGAFVQQDGVAVLGEVFPGHEDITSPTERRHGPVRAHQHRSVLQPFAAPPPDEAHHAEKRTAGSEERNDGSGHKSASGQFLPRKRLRRRLGGNGRHGLFLRRFRQDGQFAVDRYHAQRQHEREHHRPQQHDAVETVEGLAAQQQFEEQVENSQTAPDLQAVNHQVIHGYRRFSFSIRSISSRSSPTEIFSSSTSAETAPRYEFSK